jgi:hypothetical protein
VQGFLFSKALSAAAFEELLVEQRRVTSLTADDADSIRISSAV